MATDLIYHVLAPLLLAIAGNNGTYPARVTANGGLYLEKDGREIPDVFMMSVDYPDEFSLHLMSGGPKPAHTEVSKCGRVWK